MDGGIIRSAVEFHHEGIDEADGTGGGDGGGWPACLTRRAAGLLAEHEGGDDGDVSALPADGG